jgi:hypothetical protein
MAETISDRAAEAERLRGYFEVQLRVGDRMAELTGAPLGEAYLTFTNLHRRFGFGRAAVHGPAPGWRQYVAGVERCATPAARLDWTVAVFAATRPEPAPDPIFGCFSCDPPTPEGVVRIHFGNHDSADGIGPLDRRKADRRIAELRAMFAHVRQRHPDARTVVGGSWLYNLPAYCRLFPPQYVASRFTPDRVRLDGTSSWGQLLDFRGSVKPEVRAAVLRNLEGIDPAAPWRIFPLQALRAEAPVEAFHRHYEGSGSTAA